MAMSRFVATANIVTTTRTTVMCPQVVDPRLGKHRTNKELAEVGRGSQVLWLQWTAQKMNRGPIEDAAPGVETAEGYNPPEASDDGSGPHSSDRADDEEARRFNVFQR